MRTLHSRATARRVASGDAGFTLVELLVAMGIAAVLAAVVAPLVLHFSRAGAQLTERSKQWNLMNSASTMLSHDVASAFVLRTGTATELDLLIKHSGAALGQPDGACVDHDWKIDTEVAAITMTARVYGNPDCTGDPSAPISLWTIPRADTTVSAFQYTMRGQLGGHRINLTNLPDGKIQNGHDIGEVDWTWSTAAYADGSTSVPLAFTDSANIQADGTDPATRSTALQATPPVLKVITTPEGKVAPQLQWVDPTPAVTASFTIERLAYPEDAGADPGQQPQAYAAIFTPSDPTTHTWTWTDTTLPAGWTAVYDVVAGLTDSTWGPQSNTVSTGLRPAQVTNVVATGHPTSITLTWDPQIGATAYDIYRDGVLAAWTTGHSATTFTDQPGVYQWAGDGYGHSHKYNVVAVNRWEDLLTTGIVAKPLDPTSQTWSVSQVYQAGTTRLASADTAASGAFTAPDPPTITVTPNSSWGMSVAWSPAPWTGSGPTSKGGVARDRGWLVQTNGSNTAAPNGVWTAEWAGAETAAGTTTRTVAYTQAAVGGQYRTYTAATVNDVGASPASAPVTGLQRPPTPTCSASSSSTRAATVVVDRPTIPSTYTASSVSGGVKADGAAGVTGTGVQAGTTFSIDGLKHATTSTFTAANQNSSPANGGWSDATSCSTTTATLGVTITGWSSNTRTINASAAAQNGSSQNITLEGVVTFGGLTGTWDPLPDGTGYTVTARNSDGVNDVAAQAGVATQTLGTPGMPGCSISVSSGTVPGIVKVSGGSQVKLGSGGSAYGSPMTYSGLGAGTYTGYARNTLSDGYNTNYSAWSSCGTATIIPVSIGTPGPGYDGNDECNGAAIGQAASTLTAELGSVGASIGNPVPGYPNDTLGNPVNPSPSTANVYQYGVTKSGSLAGGNLGCTMYRAYSVIDPLGGVTGSFFWISAAWSQGGGAV